MPTQEFSLPWPVLPPARSWKRMGLGLALFGVLLAAISMVRFWSGHYDEWAFWVWLAAIGLYLVGVWLDGPSPARGTEVQAERAWPQPKLDRRLVFILLALILLVAVATRFYALDTFPNGCQSDECNNGMVALNWLQGAPYMPYVETNEGKLIDAKGAKGRYVRLYSMGNNSNDQNHYLEVEVFGRPVQ